MHARSKPHTLAGSFSSSSIPITCPIRDLSQHWTEAGMQYAELCANSIQMLCCFESRVSIAAAARQLDEAENVTQACACSMSDCGCGH